MMARDSNERKPGATRMKQSTLERPGELARKHLVRGADEDGLQLGTAASTEHCRKERALSARWETASALLPESN